MKYFFASNSKTKEFYHLIILLIIPCFLLCAVLTGCTKVDGDSEGTGTGTGTGAEGQPFGITVTVQDPNIGIGEVIPVTATVTDSEGTPVAAGFQIDFSITPGNLGMFTPNDYVNTSGSGEALIYLFTLEPGSGVVTAQFSGTGAWGALSIDIVGDPNTVVDPNSIPVPPPMTGTGIIGSITLSKGADSIVADGSSYAAVYAEVSDTSGMDMPDNTIVTFSTTGGDIDPLTGGIQSTVNAFTTNGIAQTTLTSSTNVGIVTIIASCNGFNTDDTVEFLPGPSATIMVEAFPDILVPDGESTSNIVVTAYDINNNPVADDTILTFSANFGELSTLLAITSKGVATVTYTAPDSSPPGGTDTVTVEAPNEQTGNVVINLSGITGDPNAPTYPIGSITVSAGSQSIVADGSTYVTVSAEVKDTIGVAIPDDTIVTFTTTAGDIDPNTVGVQNMVTALTSDGIARVRLTSSTKTGIATVTAESGGFNDNTTVEFIPGPPAIVIVQASPADLVADGLSQSTITITVLDAHNNPVSDGTQLTFDPNATNGELSSILGATSVGEATVTYTAPGYVPAGGTDTVTAETTNEITGSAVINLSGAQVAGIMLSAEPDSLPADGSSKATITAAVTIIGGGTAPDDTPVDFDIISGGGTFQIGGGTHTQSFTAGGVATARLISDPNVGIATIQATSGGITEEIQITYTPGSVILTITPNSLLGTGDESANVVASLMGASGSHAPDGEMVTFTLSDGTLGSLVDPNGQSITDPNGRAFAFSSGGQGNVSVVFQAAKKDGMIIISAKWSPGGIDITGSASAIILPSPADIRIADGFPDPMSISIKGTGGVATSRLTFDVTDAHSDPVPDGYRIDFAIQSGPNGGETIVPITSLTENGQVTTLLRSGTKAGPVSVKAYYYHDSEVSTTTSSIAISAGPPVGEEFGISAQYRNVSGLWIDGIENGITIRAGDISGNAVPDDTAISFKTYNTGGTMVPGSSETIDGAASSILESSSPKPTHGFLSVTAEATNGGRTTHVTSLAVTPSPDNSIIYAGTDGGGVYKSTDGGYSWETVSRSSNIPGQNWIDPYINAISIDPDNYNVVYAATGYLGKGNVFRSLDGGLNWNSDDPEEWNGIFNTNKAVLDVLCDDNGSPYVWIGTDSLGALYSSDGKDFGWGGIVSPSGGTIDLGGGVYSFDIAKGTMTEPTLSFSSKTESWTVTYQKTGATASVPRFTGSSADGTMPYDEMFATANADTETWTIEYAGGFDPSDANHILSLPGKGTLYVISTSEYTEDETWTLTYRDPNAGGWPAAGFYVFGDKSGPGAIYSDFTQTYNSTNNEVSFFVNQIGQFAEGDQFSFTTIKDAWSVNGSISGNKIDARTDVPYISDGSEVSFTIYRGEKKFYKFGDTWTFNTTATGNWVVEGTVSGIQNSVAETGILYRSDYNEVTFTISFGATQFAAGDEFEFDVQDSGLGYGRTVKDIIKVPGTNGATAQLYAATGRGVFNTINGGEIWTETTSFTGDNVTTIALDTDNPSVIYAGTEDNGVWVSLNGGATWSKQSNGIGKGLGATNPLPNPGNKGNGAMSSVTVDPNVLTETWTVICTTEAVDGGVFSVTGSRSGSQSDATVGVSYSSDNGSVSFIIYDGTFDFEVGDAFSFDTVRDSGSNIKDLLVDTANNKIYAITYFLGPLEAHAVGNLYVHDIQADGSFSPTDWREANQGLPQYDPPDDTTLFAQHVMAINDPVAPGVLYVGGEGINLQRAEGNLGTGSLVWEQSKSGMTNLIMARMPVLFSGKCEMKIRETMISDSIVNFTVYIQDDNGNPPVAGTTFTVKHITPTETFVLTDYIYPDCYTHQGTFSNTADAGTNNPYVYWVRVDREHEMEFTFTTPADSYPNPPGTSGADVTKSYSY